MECSGFICVRHFEVAVRVRCAMRWLVGCWWPDLRAPAVTLDCGLWGIWQQEINNCDQPTTTDAELRAQVLAQHAKHVRAAVLPFPRRLKACVANGGGHFSSATASQPKNKEKLISRVYLAPADLALPSISLA